MDMIPQRYYFAIVVLAVLIATGIAAREEQASEHLLAEPPTQSDHSNLGSVLSSCPHLNEDQNHLHDLIRFHFEDLMNSAYLGLSALDIDRAFAKYMDFIKKSCHAGGDESSKEEVSQVEKDFSNKASPLRGCPFNKTYYNVSADHQHNDKYWKLNPKTLDQRNPLQPDFLRLDHDITVYTRKLLYSLHSA
jgi:hypothetical protein